MVFKLLAFAAAVVILVFLLFAPLLMRFAGYKKDSHLPQLGLRSIWRYIRTGEKDPDNPFLN